MQNLSQPLAEVIVGLSPFPSDQIHTCQYCGNVVPKFPFSCPVPGKSGEWKTLMVQPRCKCEVDAMEGRVAAAAERKQNSDIASKFFLSVLGERYQDCTFDTFTARPGAENAAIYAKQYADNFPDHGADSLILWGVPGNGKSHLAAAVCHAIKAKGYVPVFQSVPDLLGRIRNTFNAGNKETEKDILAALQDCDLLVLDDIGAEKTTDWVGDIMFRIVDGRYRARKPIFYTTNLNMDELAEKVGGRMYDRIIETSLPVENKAFSYRVQVARERSEKERRRREWAG